MSSIDEKIKYDPAPKLTKGIKKALKGQKAKTMPDKGYKTPNQARRAITVGFMKALKKQGKIDKVGKGAREDVQPRVQADAADLTNTMIEMVMAGGDAHEVFTDGIKAAKKVEGEE